MDNGRDTLIFYNRKRRNVGFLGFQKKPPCPAKSGQSINCWLSCWNVGSDVSIVIDRFSSPGNVHPSTDTDIRHLLSSFMGRACTRSIFLCKLQPLSLFNEDRLIVACNIEPFMTGIPQEEAVLVSDHSFHPSSIPPFSLVVYQPWREYGLEIWDKYELIY